MVLIMKKLITLILILSVLICSGCANGHDNVDIVATTLPVYEFTAMLCRDTDLTVERLITENVSCLHDYTMQVHQMQLIEDSDIVVISGLGLEAFLEDALSAANFVIDASVDVHTHMGGHDHGVHEELVHDHGTDPHIWLSPENATIMAKNIYDGLCAAYPMHQEIFDQNLSALVQQLMALQTYGDSCLSNLACRELITFHDGFSYFAESFDLSILETVEEESGSEASASEIIRLIKLVNDHQLPSIFTETNGSDACAGIICAETGCSSFTLDMAMAGSSYFDAMYHNINTVKEALG